MDHGIISPMTDSNKLEIIQRNLPVCVIIGSSSMIFYVIIPRYYCNICVSVGNTPNLMEKKLDVFEKKALRTIHGPIQQKQI
jgi:K+-transporting ATPase A subunit